MCIESWIISSLLYTWVIHLFLCLLVVCLRWPHLCRIRRQALLPWDSGFSLSSSEYSDHQSMVVINNFYVKREEKINKNKVKWLSSTTSKILEVANLTWFLGAECGCTTVIQMYLTGYSTLHVVASARHLVSSTSVKISMLVITWFLLYYPFLLFSFLRHVLKAKVSRALIFIKETFFTMQCWVLCYISKEDELTPTMSLYLNQTYT